MGGLCDRLCLVLVCRGRYDLGGWFFSSFWCVFPSQCIARHTEELCEVQENTSTRAPQALSLVETNEASSRELLCATHDLAPPFHRPCGRRHKGISIKNSNQAEQDVIAQDVS
jgi:hypothetical protein